MRLLVHVDENEQARLLQQVALLRIPETLKDDPENPGQKIVDQSGKYMLITDNNLLSEYIESTNQDSQIVGQRLSSAAFSFSDPILMTGAFNSVLRCSITIDENDPLNPFLHKPHPDHDNLGFDYKPFPSDSKRYTRESYTIGRNIRLTFSENPPEGETDNTWGTTMLGGDYRETIEGVHKEDIYVEGTFELKLISKISQLNDGE
jgi:hypothetical protein